MTKTFAAAPFTAFAAAAAIALTAAAPAFAAPATPTLQVSYADLNLRDAHDAQTMLHRIRKAAVAVCGAVPGASGSSLAETDQFDACYRTTVKGAVVSLASPAVTQAYNGSGRDSEMAAR
ncbi:MAG: hypothetical protein JWP35_2901 [Caulobacter sp.]|nr:hypothetical protein [Caulobacter sp.]